MLRRALPAVALAGLLLLAACGSDSSSADTTTGSTPSSTPAVSSPTSTVAKPAVKLPTSTPTSLQTTVNTAGTGPQAKSGDIVVVDYVGVRSADGTEFDNSYDRGQPYPVKLGAGSVIPGWDQGLVGVQTGEQLQLDIPTELAYGESPQGDVIQPGDALSFVIDVRAVVPATTAADQPQVTVTGAPNRERPRGRGSGRRHGPGAAGRTDRCAPADRLPRRHRRADLQHLGRWPADRVRLRHRQCACLAWSRA